MRRTLTRGGAITNRPFHGATPIGSLRPVIDGAALRGKRQRGTSARDVVLRGPRVRAEKRRDAPQKAPRRAARAGPRRRWQRLRAARHLPAPRHSLERRPFRWARDRMLLSRLALRPDR